MITSYTQLHWFARVDHTTPMDQIKKAYTRLIMEHHPDRGGTNEDMARINEEYDYLKRRNYNIHTAANGNVYTDEKEDGPDPVTNDFANIIATLLHMGLSVEVCGTWLWISGDTKPHKDDLKALGAKWAARKKLWFIAPEGSKNHKHHLDMDEIRARYGSTTYTRPKAEDAAVAVA